ncbi:hypothetical protein [Niveispirillum irakense]|uniref:hypothetical protein n=1 Tax=Niveispirillum irakense TaxID=34011 RepID=UPI0012B67203|nr:hypothetical protein [Niveispirillum irakense]
MPRSLGVGVAKVVLRSLFLGALLMLAACTAPPPHHPAPDAELVFWESIRNSDNPAEFQAYLNAFPHGRFTELARLRLQAIVPPVATAPVQEPPAKKPAPQRPSTPQTKSNIPPAAQQGEPQIVDKPQPPVMWAKVEDVTGTAGPGLRSQVMDCWTPPPLPRGVGTMRAEIGLYFDDGGRIRGAAFLGGNKDMTEPSFAAFVQSALAAPMSPGCRDITIPQQPAGQEAGERRGVVLLFGLDSPP